MDDLREKVGFDLELENDIIATIECEGSSPGYLRLRQVDNGEMISLPENKDSLQWNVLDPRQKWKSLFYSISSKGPASTKVSCLQGVDDYDEVPYFSCSSWPPIAESWICRERQCDWLSKETIEKIVSIGCRVVHKAHERTKERDTKFRFSFSTAELILFETLSSTRKKCFIAFKALIKYGLYRSESGDLKVSTYCLKTIFLWTCESISADQWESADGWARCLLALIDRLYECLKSRNLPGYFIRESNLLDCFGWTTSSTDLRNWKIEKWSRDICCIIHWCHELFPWLHVTHSWWSRVIKRRRERRCIGEAINVLAEDGK